jgi:hypothetical protein
MSRDDIASPKQTTGFEARLEHNTGELLFWSWLPLITSLGTPGEG